MAKTLTPPQPFHEEDTKSKCRFSWSALSKRNRVTVIVAVVTVVALLGGGYYYLAEYRPQQLAEEEERELREQAQNAFGGEILEVTSSKVTVEDLAVNEQKTFEVTADSRIGEGPTDAEVDIDALEAGRQANVMYDQDTKEAVSIWMP